MNSVRKYSVVLLFFILGSCGTHGHMRLYNFIVSKAEAKNELIKTIEVNGYSAPDRWNGYEWGRRNEDMFIFFDNNPKELYWVKFSDFSESPSVYKDKTVLALVGVFDGTTWLFERDLSRREQIRIEERFENEILRKMTFSYTKE